MKEENCTEMQQSKIDKVFILVKDQKKDVRICLGTNIVSMKKFPTFEAADKYIKTRPYELILNSIHVITRLYNENKKNSENAKSDK